MATKLKNIKFSNWFKLLAVIIGLWGVAVTFYGGARYPDFSYGVQAQDYKQSDMLKWEIKDINDRILLLTTLQSEDYIKSGAVIKDDDLERKKEEIKDKKTNEIRHINRQYNINYNKTEDPDEKQQLTVERDEKITRIKTEADKAIAGIPETIIAEKIVQYNAAKYFLDSYEGLYYTVMAKELVSGNELEVYNSLPYYTKKTTDKDNVVYIGFSDEAFLKQVAEYDSRHQNGLAGIYMMFSGMGIALLSIIWLMFSAGRTPENDGLHFNFFDKMYLDIGFWLTSTILLPCCIAAAMMSQEAAYVPVYAAGGIAFLSIAYLTIAAYAVIFSKRIKNHEAFKHTMLYQLFTDIKKIMDTRSLSIRVVGFLLSYALVVSLICLLFVEAIDSFLGLVIVVLLLIAVTMGAVKLLLKPLTGFENLANGVRKIKQGDLTHKIPECGSATIDIIAADINNIADGIQAAVDREIKAEHMKVELITNVSHDLKTPLTSIITYADLLSRQENILSEQVKEYVEIIKTKSVRLKQMVDDLFEVSKAQSGTIAVTSERLCANDLITQSFVEYEENFKNAGLDVMLNIPQNKIMVLADGAKMWRVLSNVYTNAIKYSLAGTRVYVDLEVVNDKAQITIKNIANYVMHFKSDEICERFMRGDEARSGEGSGLGLAIVKSFMELQTGSCTILVDGDLFKVVLTLPQNG